ncbi:MAG TPA: DbpA RNA binding domain-containing protein [Planctomycetota bacterium]|nr:DbpA RNA binding domain-containing protein [Planctomycetota bacterium]
MNELPPLASGYIRIALLLRNSSLSTPGAIATAAGVGADDLGPIAIIGDEAFVDVKSDVGKAARDALSRWGPTRLAERHWQWLRIAIGRNHGLTMGQLRRLMQNADAAPLGKIIIQNTHTLVGLQDHKTATVIERLASAKINGYNPRPTALPLGEGPGSAAFVPKM